MNRFEKLNKFPMGFWNYADADKQTCLDVEDWIDLGMSIAMSPEYDFKKNNKEDFVKILDKAHEKDIKVIICDSRGYWNNLDKGEEEYVKGFNEALADFGSHPAIVGFHVGDEPDRKAFKNACRAYRIQKELAPQLSPFVNLLAWWREEEPIRELVGYADWELYLETFIKDANADLLCYDFYRQMNPNNEDWDSYFTNLNYYNNVSLKSNIPYWTTLLSVGHFRYRCPNLDDFRWQINSAVAHGAKGILWFFIYGRNIESNYRYAPIDEFGKKTLTYDWLAYAIKMFRLQFDGIINDLELQNVYHYGKVYGTTKKFEKTKLVNSVKSDYNTPLIISEFKNSKSENYIAVVNNSVTDSDYISLSLNGVNPNIYSIVSGGVEREITSKESMYYKSDYGFDYGTVSFWLAPGQMEIFKVI